jgi:hypothetical protein
LYPQSDLDTSLDGSYFSAMRLRDHPALYVAGVSNWPPVWSTTNKEETEIPVGEVGILKEVITTEATENTIFLRIDYRDKNYMGCLPFTDRLHWHFFYIVLKGLVRHSIKEIGDFDVSSAL